ncbi:MAG: NIPSNAP family containing protein [Thermus sp.]|uniref:NIPSNAP family containing protein n=1 Tax=Thermus sp. TaxID=275 RepID=UPI003327E07E
MTVQMRRYRLREGATEGFLRFFREVVVPLRKEVGFHILGAYLLSKQEFLWFVAHENFEEAEKAYYAHPRRQGVDSGAYIAEMEVRFVEALEV